MDKLKLKYFADECTKRLVKLIKKSFGEQIEIELIDLESQLKKAVIDLKGKETISLDTYYTGNYNLEASRLFDVSDYQHTNKRLNARLDGASLVDSVSKIKQGKNDVFEIADFRDFLIGGKNGGLLVRLSNSKTARAPYILPYVNMKTRVSIPTKLQKAVSLEIWELNKWFYEQLDDQIILKDTDVGFQKLMKFVGFKDESSMVDICKWHIKNLK